MILYARLSSAGSLLVSRHASYIRIGLGRIDHADHMTGRAEIHRSAERSSGYLWRMSREDKELLHERASSEGLTIQAYLEQVALGREPVIRRAGRPRTSQQELPIGA